MESEIDPNYLKFNHTYNDNRRFLKSAKTRNINLHQQLDFNNQDLVQTTEKINYITYLCWFRHVACVGLSAYLH